MEVFTLAFGVVAGLVAFFLIYATQPCKLLCIVFLTVGIILLVGAIIVPAINSFPNIPEPNFFYRSTFVAGVFLAAFGLGFLQEKKTG